jgi:hypothetical protein
MRSMRRNRRQHGLGEDGIALITTLLVVLVVGALVMGAIILGSNHILVDKYWARQSNLVGLTDAGLEVTRSYLNADKSLFPDTAFATIENGVAVHDGEGSVIPGIKRSTYVGPTGITSGQFGVFGSIVSVVEDEGGGIAVRRQQVFQESFAKFAYFTDNEGGNIYFASNDHIWGPLHTNDRILIHSTRANFHDRVTVGADIYQPWYGTFDKGYEEYSPIIPMPETADLLKLKKQARLGHTDFVGDLDGGDGEATTRIQFIAIDLNGDGDRSDDDEGFFRVYQSNDFDWVAAKSSSNYLLDSENCGDYHTVSGVPTFISAQRHYDENWGHTATTALTSSTRRCYLGGADEIWGGFQANDGRGQWLPWNGAIDSRVAALRADAGYLFPMTRPLNPDFKGVVFVDGKVIVSGEIRGRVTVAATDNIIFGNDITYVTDPGAGTCDDIAGYFSGERVVMSNNSLNAATRPRSGYSYRTYDESTGEFFHGVVLALDIFTAEEYTYGSTSAQYCEGTRSGRGCIYLTGGIIQNKRGAVGLTDGHGYVKRYSYDKCAATQPPPYFPSTGVFVKGQYYQVDPAGFDINEYFSLIAPGVTLGG